MGVEEDEAGSRPKVSAQPLPAKRAERGDAGIPRWAMWTAKRSVPFCCDILFLLFAGAILASPNPALAQAFPQPKLTPITVIISPPKATLFAGETQVFVATVVGGGDKAVTWSVAEEGGGTVTNQGLYTAPKVQGIYHVTAASTGDPKKPAVATVTVLAYCDPPAAFMR